MPDFELYSIAESGMTISGGAQLSGITQGDGSHLVGETITLNTGAWESVIITDNDNFFADNDGNQSLTNATTYGGVSYSAGDGVEAEYTLTVEDPSGNSYKLIGFNINEAGTSPAYRTVEGLGILGYSAAFGCAPDGCFRLGRSDTEQHAFHRLPYAALFRDRHDDPHTVG